MNVLLLDDDQAVREAFSRGLQRFGHQVVAVSSLADAHEALARATPDCALLDLILQNGELGTELVQDLHKLDAGMPILFITGRPEHPIFRSEVISQTVYSILEKPVSLGKLKTMMEWAVEKRQQSKRPTSAQLDALLPKEDELKTLIVTWGWKKFSVYLFFIAMLLTILFYSIGGINDWTSTTIENQETGISGFMKKIDGYLKRDEIRELKFKSRGNK